MDIRKRTFAAIILACGMLFQVATTQAHNLGYAVPSPGVPGATITLTDGTEGAGEWAGSTSFNIVDYGGGNPLCSSMKALHKADGIYLLMIITDPINNPDDTVQIRFDINHNGSALTEASDWGVEVRRNGQAKWGPANADPGTWGTTGLAGNVGVNPSITISTPPCAMGATSGWSVEFRLPTGVPSGLSLGVGVGIHFKIYDISQENGVNSAIYTQWPAPTVADVNGLNTLFDSTPNKWGDYVFDPTTTFPNIAITGVRRSAANVGDYNTIDYAGINTFVVRVKNPGGTAIPDASDVRLNLYLAARGIGEPWHRLDTPTVLDDDCSKPNSDPIWALSSSIINKTDVCSGSTSLDDISAQNITDVLNGTAKYTIKNGLPLTVNRLGGNPIIPPVAAGIENWFDVIGWNTTSTQDTYFTGVRKHQCMLAQAIFPNDPNIADNVQQVNMEFVGLPGTLSIRFPFSFGWAGFGKYDPNIGKDMFLQVVRRNMSPNAGWKYQLEGFEPVREDVFVAKLQGKQSMPVQLALTAPPAGILGKALKENLIVPPKAGGHQVNARIPSGEPPVYVKVKPGSTLLIANFAFSENDPQQVDLDGEGKLLPPNGPAGLPSSFLQQVSQKIGEKYQLLLAPNAPLGALVGSFDNFRTAFTIGEGVQVKVPADAKYLALGINDAIGLSDDNKGTGFRIKVSEMESASGMGMLEKGFVSAAMAQKPDSLQIIPLSEVIPTLCINGYEDIGQTRTIGGKQRELFRYIGNVCWGVINVYPQDRSDKPDQGDPFEETHEWWHWFKRLFMPTQPKMLI